MKSKLDAFIKIRNDLIERLDRGEITKPDFVEQNYQLIHRLSMVPYLKVTCYEQGLYNYHYYNGLAKYWNNIANEYKKKNQKKYSRALNKCNNYYVQKDKNIEELLRVVDVKEVDAYYIPVYSTRMKDRLIEIVLRDKEKCIFHTMSPKIIMFLQENNLLDDKPRKSLIDEYVNDRY